MMIQEPPHNPLFDPDPILPDYQTLTPEEEIKVLQGVIEHGTFNRAKKAKALPNIATTRVQLFRLCNPKFAERFQTARELGMEKLFEEALEIAFDSKSDVFGVNKDGKVKISYECVNRSKLKIETIYRTLAVINPALYSEAFYKAKDRKIKLKKAISNKVEDRLEVVYESVTTGKITPEEGSRVGGLLEIQQRAVDNREINLRLQQLEEARDKSNAFNARPK